MLRIAAISALILFLSLFGEVVVAQSSYEYMRDQIRQRQDATRTQIEQLDQQIAAFTARLNETTEEYQETYRRYEETNRLIALQQERLRQLNRQQRQIEEEIVLVRNNIEETKKRLRELIEQYKETLTYLYKNGRTTELALLFTSGSLNQLMVRSFYLSRFNDHVESRMNQIRETQRELEQSQEDLESSLERNQIALDDIREQREQLRQQEQQLDLIVEALQDDIDQLESRKAQTEQEKNNLENTMQKLMLEEERLRREAEAGGSVERRELFVTAEQLDQFEEEFRNKRGQLPWPVRNGTITEQFGERIHPVFNTRTRNLGVDIAVSPESEVRVVNDGYVYGIQPLQGYGDVVFVNHGAFKTAYGNLSEIRVRPNEVLREGDVIGYSGNEESIRGPVLFFLINENGQMVDPELWLSQARS